MQTHKLTVNVLIKDDRNGRVSAWVLDLPEYKVVSCDRESAIAQLQQKLANALSGSEIVTLEVDLSKPEHPWKQFAGMFGDSELFEAVLENIAANRHYLNRQVAEDESEK